MKYMRKYLPFGSCLHSLCTYKQTSILVVMIVEAFTMKAKHCFELKQIRNLELPCQGCIDMQVKEEMFQAQC